MEHIEQAGVHSGDSACVIPAYSLSDAIKEEITGAAKALAKALDVRGLMNIQFAVKDEELYVIEVNPRASRTVPFVSKATGVPLAKLAAKIMAGKKLKELGFTEAVLPSHYSVKEAVFPFIKFPGTDIALGPEMKSTGEVMGIDSNLGMAYAKSQMAASAGLPTSGNVFISVADRQKPQIGALAKRFHELGFKIFATSGTGKVLGDVPFTRLPKLHEGRPNVLDMIKNGEIQLIVNTPDDRETHEDAVTIRSAATANRIPIMTTLSGTRASVEAIASLQDRELTVIPLQDYH
jgi:carbamoyl-phosphate synthase large subunit